MILQLLICLYIEPAHITVQASISIKGPGTDSLDSFFSSIAVQEIFWQQIPICRNVSISTAQGSYTTGDV